jgi:hypothetical protein
MDATTPEAGTGWYSDEAATFGDRVTARARRWG